ncbi:MAG: ABC transporter substrate-binding protein [Candidatus Competibacterales bacterium]
MLSLRLVLCLLAVAHAPLSLGLDRERLRIGTEAAYPPFAYVDEQGEMQGFDIDITKALCDVLEVECTLINQNFDGLIPALRARKFDAVVASMSITEERKKSVDFTDKYYKTPAKFVAAEGADLTISPEGLADKTVGVQRATTHDRYLSDQFPDTEIRRYGTQEEAFLDLQAGRIDAILADSVAIQDGFLGTESGEGFAFIGPNLVDPQWFGEGAGIAVRPGDDELRQALNQAIVTLRENGTYDEIQKKYFDFDIYGQ